jgi:hypothetical protein
MIRANAGKKLPRVRLGNFGGIRFNLPVTDRCGNKKNA